MSPRSSEFSRLSQVLENFYDVDFRCVWILEGEGRRGEVNEGEGKGREGRRYVFTLFEFKVEENEG